MNNTNFAQWVRYSVTFRIAVVGILALLLLIPVSMVGNLIRDREFTKRTAVAEISQKWGEKQTLAGPILSVPYSEDIINRKGEQVSVTKYAHFLPETLFVDGELSPQIRSRGIFDAVVYSSDINFSGKFTKPNLSALGIEDARADWSKAFVSVGISDTRGIQENIKLNWNDAEIQFKPGIKTDDVIRDGQSGNNYDREPYYGKRIVYQELAMQSSPNPTSAQSSGISAQLPTNIKSESVSDYEFAFTLKVNGSQEIQFAPIGRTTKVSLKSEWQAPSFSGAFLPDERVISDDGFTASWKILDLNRGYPQSWLGNTYNIYASASGVKLLTMIDGYKKASRSAKYALLIISLTYLVFFFVEILNKRRVHPIQYILVGLAIVLFYALLVSMSEIIGFGLAYLISSVATIGLIALYSKTILASVRMATIQTLILSFLYLFIYIILQLEDYALLIGSILLFSILATVMYLSRKIDWYGIGDKG